MIAAVIAVGKAGLVDQLGDHHQPHTAQWSEADKLLVYAGCGPSRLIAIQAAVMHIDRQAAVAANRRRSPSAASGRSSR